MEKLTDTMKGLWEGFVALFSRPEVVTLLTAAVVTYLANSGLADQAGLPIPESAIKAFWAVFLGALVEGKFRADYQIGLKQFVLSRKNQLAFLQLLGGFVNSWLPEGNQLSEETVTSLGNFFLAAIIAVAGLDSYKAAIAPNSAAQ